MKKAYFGYALALFASFSNDGYCASQPANPLDDPKYLPPKFVREQPADHCVDIYAQISLDPLLTQVENNILALKKEIAQMQENLDQLNAQKEKTEGQYTPNNNLTKKQRNAAASLDQQISKLATQINVKKRQLPPSVANQQDQKSAHAAQDINALKQLFANFNNKAYIHHDRLQGITLREAKDVKEALDFVIKHSSNNEFEQLIFVFFQAEYDAKSQHLIINPKRHTNLWDDPLWRARISNWHHYNNHLRDCVKLDKTDSPHGYGSVGLRILEGDGQTYGDNSKSADRRWTGNWHKDSSSIVFHRYGEIFINLKAFLAQNANFPIAACVKLLNDFATNTMLQTESKIVPYVVNKGKPDQITYMETKTKHVYYTEIHKK